MDVGDITVNVTIEYRHFFYEQQWGFYNLVDYLFRKRERRLYLQT